MSSKGLWRNVAISLLAAGPAGGLIFGLLNAGDSDPNPIGRLAHACMMMVMSPLHAGFPPNIAAGAGHSLNAWPHIAIAFLLVFGGLAYQDWKLANKHETEPCLAS